MQKIKENYIYYFLILLPIIDIITSLCIRFTSITISPSLILRGIFLAVCIGYTLFSKNLKYRKESILFYFISFVFFLIYIFSKINYLNLNSIVYEVSSFIKFWYFPIIVFFMLNAYESKKLDISKLPTILDINLLTYSLGIIIPKITNTAFDSYAYGNSGIVGWFYAANEIGVIITTLFCIKMINIDNKKYIKKYILSLLTIISLSLIGTKVVTFSLLIIITITLVFSLIKNKFNIKSKDLIYSLIIFIFGMFVVFQSNTISNVLNRIELKKQTSETTPKTSKKPNNNKPVIEKKSDTLIGMLFSGRDIYLKNNYQLYKNNSTFNKIIGIGFVNRNNEKIKLVEIDIFDILFCYGIIGSLIYLSFIIWVIYLIIKNIIKIRTINTNILKCSLFIGLVIGISSVAGHVLGAPTVTIYLALLIVILYHLTKEGKEITNYN